VFTASDVSVIIVCILKEQILSKSNVSGTTSKFHTVSMFVKSIHITAVLVATRGNKG
jgi:hypothetical protein